ncbi:hypothetical protein [Mesorhizobium sp. 1B3]|uniref:hypothetical protein n=1 Tax=Mesorhizobium sp. 1B3 TaxID=3243599 RepID=UPI003D98AAA0
MIRAVLSAFLPLAAASAALGVTNIAAANEMDKKFFQQIEGEWVGPGEIVAGKYKGTKFTCSFTGSTPEVKVGMTLAGSCRVGVFTQKMSATVERGTGGYRGTFMDGAAGKGLDVVSGNVDGRRVVLGLNRAALKGAMIAKLSNDDAMTVTVSVRVEKQMIPVIGMNLKRVDGAAVGSIAQQQ